MGTEPSIFVPNRSPNSNAKPELNHICIPSTDDVTSPTNGTFDENGFDLLKCLDIVNNSSKSSINSYNSHRSPSNSTTSRQLLTMNTTHLAQIVKYIVENEQSFAKYKHQSNTISAAFITHKIKGKMLYELTSHEFRDELPWIRNVISVQIYDYLNTLSERQIQNIYYLARHNDTTRDIHITLPSYLKLIDINSAAKKLPFSRYDEHQFQLFVYIMLHMYKYKETVTESVMKALLETHLNGESFTALKRTEFCRVLKVHDIKGAVASKLHKMIVLHSDNISAYIQTHNIYLSIGDHDGDVVQQLVALGYGTKEEVITAAKMAINPSDINDVLDVLQTTQHNKNSQFHAFICNLLLCKEYDESVIDAMLNALDDTMDTEQFMQLKRMDLSRLLKPYGIKAGVASKIYKLIIANLADIDRYSKNKQSLHVLWNSNETDIAINDEQNEIDLKRKSVDSAYSRTDIKNDDTMRSSSASSDNDDIKYNETVIDQLVSLGYGTREQCIKASQLTTNWWDINEVAESLRNTQSSSPSTQNMRNVDVTIPMLDHTEFVSFVYNVSQINPILSQQNIDEILRAITQLNMNGNMFMKLSRATFGRELKAYGIKAGFASKVYKLIMAIDTNLIGAYLEPKYRKDKADEDRNDDASDDDVVLSEYDVSTAADNAENVEIVLSEYDIAEIAVVDFQRSAHKMLKNMNNSMKINGVNGKILSGHYESKQYLREYLVDHVRAKSVDILCEMIWDDYGRGGERKRNQIEQYDRKNLLKYFISLYMFQLKSMIIGQTLNETKCASLPRKAICSMVIDECGLSIGAATNIANKIYETITPQNKYVN